MTFTAEQVEWIVVEVVRRLRLLEASSHRVAVVERSSTTAAAPSELRLEDRLVTLKTIDRRLAGIGRLVVCKNAVITPAVRDELKKYKVELVREAGP
jgi:hypothetical protein